METVTDKGAGDIRVQVMREDDVAAGLRLASASGWNQRIEDWRLIVSLSPRGNFVAYCDSSLVGTTVTLNYENKVSWIAMVLVDPAMRRRGIATLLMKAALDNLAGCETIKLDATPAGREVYLKLGFVDESRSTRLALETPPAPGRPERQVRLMEESDLPAVIDLDARVFGVPRPDLIRGIRALAPAYALVAEGDGGVPAGFSLGRPGARWEYIGPVTARDEATARSLVRAALEKMGGRPATIDAPEASASWQAWLKGLGFTEQRVLTRMYRGPNRYKGKPEQVFSIVGPEFG